MSKQVKTTDEKSEVYRIELPEAMDFAAFSNHPIVVDDMKNWQLGRKLDIIGEGYSKGFQLGDRLFYEYVTPEGMKILHCWSVGSSLDNAGLDNYYWSEYLNELVMRKCNWAKTPENRKIFIQKQVSVMSVFTFDILKHEFLKLKKQ